MLSRFNLIIPTKFPGEYLLTNMMTGAVIGIDEEVKTIIEKGELHALDSDTLNTLEELGVVVPDHADEYRKFKLGYEKRKYGMGSPVFTLITTYACNLACPYCYEGRGELFHGTMNEDTRERAVTFIKRTVEEHGAKKFSIALYGGEPLLNFDDSVYIMDSCFTWAEEKGIDYISLMLTNGTLVTPEIAEKLREYHTKSVQITLDGPKRIHDKKRVYKNEKGTFNDIITSTVLLRDHGVPVVFRINIDTENKPYVGELLDELDALGLKDVPVLCAAISEGQLCGSYPQCIHDRDVFKTIAEARTVVKKKGQATPRVRVNEESQFFCGFLREGQYLLDPYADVYKCLTFVGLKEHCIGHITPEGELEPTWVYYDWMSRDPLTIQECLNCTILPACGGGCAAVAYERHKTYHAPGCYSPSSAKEQVHWYLRDKFPHYFNV